MQQTNTRYHRLNTSVRVQYFGGQARKKKLTLAKTVVKVSFFLLVLFPF